jgi:predicted ribosomally synthesized peptide with SipW-like signal peptide
MRVVRPRKGLWNEQPIEVLRTFLVLGIVACIAGAGVFSAFSSQTDYPGNIITAGTVKLEDNNGGSALYTIAAAKPGDSKTSCINVTYTGSLPSTV